MPPRRVLISTGELSGDYHAAHLVRALRAEAARRGITLDIAAIGSVHLPQVADHMWEDSTRWAGIGIFESFKVGPRILAAFQRIKRRLRQWRPELVITVDFRVVHLRLLTEAKRAGARTAYYFPPVHWGSSQSKAREALVKAYEGGGATKKRDRFDQIAAVTDLVLLTYPLSEEHYRRAGANVEYIGHPLANALEAELTRPADEVRAEWGLPPKSGDPAAPLLIGILPGSREQEIRDFLPPIIATLANLGPRYAATRWYLSCAHPRFRKRLNSAIAALPPAVRERVTLVEGADPNLLRASDLLLMKSGTAAQTALLLETPMVTFYKLGVPPIIGPPVWALSTALFIKLPYWTFPNLLAGRAIVPELIQTGFTGETLTNAVETLMRDPAARAAQVAELHTLREQLWRPDALTRSASLCLDLLEPEQRS
ncbi:MAG: hypothetical protein ABI743_05005 [bacterium]